MSEPPIPGEFSSPTAIDWRAAVVDMVERAEARWGLLTYAVVGAVIGAGGLLIIVAGLYAMAHL